MTEYTLSNNYLLTPITSPETKIQSHLVNTRCIALDLQGTRKRKRSPQRLSPSSLRIIKLDVYRLYSALPKTLLYKRQRSLVDTYDYAKQRSRLEKVETTSVSSASSSNGSSFKYSCSMMPVDQTIDFSLYKNTLDAPVIEKKGTPLIIPADTPHYDELTAEEVRTCSTLRMLPAQYLHVKKTMISATFHREFFNKRDAQVWFKMDVNKTCLLYGWFQAIGWIPTKENWFYRP